MADVPTTPVSDPQLGQLSRLHRMSRTAGANASEYTAVNVAAVVAVLVGAASAMSLMTPVFLFLPAVGVIVAGLAIAQIRSSNGTQTGLALAVLGLVLSIGLSGVTGFQYLQKLEQERSDSRALNALVVDFGNLLAKKDYEGAYRLTDARFQEQTPLPAFREAFDSLGQSPSTGTLTGIRSNNLFGIEVDPDSNLRLAVGFALIDTQNLNADRAIRLEVRFRNTAESWKIIAIPNLFAPKTPAPGGGGPAAGPSGGAGGGAGGGAASGGPAGPPAPR